MRMVVMPDLRGRRLLAHHRYRIVFRLWVTFTPSGGKPRSLDAYGVHLGSSRASLAP